ncbi:MAG: 16S rRNA (cytosine(1402)-N(4))-methyltransferase RsmH [Campylobacterales bacterium]
MNAPHIPVLLDHVLELFSTLKSGIVVDCTVGYGGHAEAILQHYPHLSYIGIDQDEEALAFSRARLASFGERVRLIHGRASEILPTLIHEPVVAVLADIGVSSLQLDKSERGFGFESETLDMRMDRDRALTAKEVVNRYPVHELERILKEYGEERHYKKIARLIDEARKKAEITSAKELAQLIARYFPKGRIHPATLTFQAIRIEVNDELSELQRLLEAVKELGKGVIVGIISFHSLEDRIVKQTFKEWAKSCICPAEAMRCVCGNDHALGEILTKRPLEASEEEIKFNPRARSAKLRAFRFRS